MTRESDVVRSLVEMADTLVEDYDVVDLLTRLADRCVSLLGVSAAGVMLASPAGKLGLVASSSEAMRLLELFELQAQEGPCLDAFRTGDRIEHEDLQAGSGRWPSFSAAALEAGFRSASALPLRLREVTLGALNLLSATNAPMDEADIIVARAFADLAALSIVQHRASTEAQRLNEQLSSGPDQPRGDRAGQRRDRRTRWRQPGRGLLPVAGLRPQPQPPPHRCRPGCHRRHPRPAGIGPRPCNRRSIGIDDGFTGPPGGITAVAANRLPGSELTIHAPVKTAGPATPFTAPRPITPMTRPPNTPPDSMNVALYPKESLRCHVHVFETTPGPVLSPEARGDPATQVDVGRAVTGLPEAERDPGLFVVRTQHEPRA